MRPPTVMNQKLMNQKLMELSRVEINQIEAIQLLLQGDQQKHVVQQQLQAQPLLNHKRKFQLKIAQLLI